MSDTSGRMLQEPSAVYDPASSCWKMFGGMFPSEQMPSLPTLPPWGMTRGGELFELPTPGPLTAEPDGSSLPTPTSRDYKGANQRGDDSCLHGALLPTPNASLIGPHGERGARTLESRQGKQVELPDVIGALLPTPAVNDMGEGKTPEHWDEWTATMQEKHGNGNGHGKSLAIEAQRLLPTPTAGDSKAAGSRNLEGSAAHPGVSLTDLLLYGGSTSPRSDDGNESSDDPRLLLLNEVWPGDLD